MLLFSLILSTLVGVNSITNIPKVHIARTTAYSHATYSCGKLPLSRGYGRTSTGVSVFENPYVVATNPKIYPYGTILYIEGVGFRLVADTGGFSKKHPKTIDIYFNKSRKELLKYGVKYKKVAIVRYKGKWSNIQISKLFKDFYSEYSLKSGEFLGVPEVTNYLKQKSFRERRGE